MYDIMVNCSLSIIIVVSLKYTENEIENRTLHRNSSGILVPFWG